MLQISPVSIQNSLLQDIVSQSRCWAEAAMTAPTLLGLGPRHITQIPLKFAAMPLSSLDTLLPAMQRLLKSRHPERTIHGIWIDTVEPLLSRFRSKAGFKGRQPFKSYFFRSAKLSERCFFGGSAPSTPVQKIVANGVEMAAALSNTRSFLLPAEKTQDVRSTVEKASRNQNLAIGLTTLAPLVNEADAERISQTRHKLITDQDHEARKEAITLTKELTGRYSPLGEYIGPTLRNTLNTHSPSPTQLSSRQVDQREMGELKRKLEEEAVSSSAKDRRLQIAEATIRDRDDQILEKDQTILEKDQALIEKDQTISEQDHALGEKDRIIADLLAQLAAQKK